MREIVFDVETTGLDPESGDRITELGCVEVVDYIPTGRTFQAYVNPERVLDAKAVEITGLTNEFLADKPVFAAHVERLLDFIGDARVVAHNASFDRGFLNMELKRAGLEAIPIARWFDTLELARTMFPGMHNSLDALCKRFNVSLEARDKHGALLDARLLAEVYLHLNGGREQSLDLTVDQGARAARRSVSAIAEKRPKGPLSTSEEHEAHATFVATLSGDPLWAKVRASDG